MKTITTEALQQKLNQGEQVNLLDVREVDEVSEGHIAGITHIPLGLLEFRMNELDKNKPYIVICRSGGRSGKAVQFLESHGYDVTNMTGGMLDWNGPVAKK